MVLKPGEEAAIWIPETDADRQLVLLELNAILLGPHFRSSKRYPSLLRYVVEKTLDGQPDRLKERTLGVEVFERRPDYDTNADPVVRFSAGEVRKRIAQHYHEKDGESDIQIELPLGSYAAQFKRRCHATGPTQSKQKEHLAETVSENQVEPIEVAPRPKDQYATAETKVVAPLPAVQKRRWPLLLGAFLTVALFSCGAVAYYNSRRPNPIDQFWNPLLQTPGSVLIVVGSGLDTPPPEEPNTSFFEHMVGPNHHISVSAAIAISHLTNVIQQRGGSYAVKESGVSSLTDLSGRPVILVSALNNAWTLRLMEPLRYRFIPGPQARIEDRQNPQNHEWAVDFSKPFISVTSDYAIIARYHDASTNAPVLIVGGIGPFGSIAASKFVSSPEYLQQVEKMVHGGLDAANLEMVIRTDLIAGEAGPPHLVAVTTF